MKILPDSLMDLIDELQKLPGIGNKSAAKIAYHFLKIPKEDLNTISQIFAKLKDNVVKCNVCCNFSDSKICSICDDSERDFRQIMVVEDPLDTIAFEEIGLYKGTYHVLGGKISPINGIGPDELTVKELEKRIKNLSKKGSKKIEIIFATTPDLAGEATSAYLRETLSKFPNLKFTSLARGLPTGADLEYADKRTLQNAFKDRKVY